MRNCIGLNGSTGQERFQSPTQIEGVGGVLHGALVQSSIFYSKLFGALGHGSEAAEEAPRRTETLTGRKD